MKYILSTLLTVFTFSPVVSAENNIAENQEKLVNSFSQKAEEIITKKWEDYRDLIIYILKEFSQRRDVKPETAFAISTLADMIKKNKDKVTWPQEFTDLNIDIETVKQTWLDWINTERKSIWVTPYTYENKLEKTALIWSQLSKSKWYIDHKISPWDSYYDYWKKAAWMKQHWVVCKNISKITFSESIGWGTFTCSDNDCTDELTEWIKSTFDFFMSEKGKSYKPHYEAIAGKLFKTMWLGITLEKTWTNRYKYYLTNHYCTQLQ